VDGVVEQLDAQPLAERAERSVAADIDRLQMVGHCGRVAKMEAAAADGKSQQSRQREAPNRHYLSHLTAKVTSLPGTTFAILISLPSRNRCTLSLALACAITSSCAASAATSICARTLPLICTARVTRSRTNALSSTDGQG